MANIGPDNGDFAQVGSGGSSTDESSDVEDDSGQSSSNQTSGSTRNALEGLGTSQREIEEEQSQDPVDNTPDVEDDSSSTSSSNNSGRTRNALEGLGTSEREIEEQEQEEAVDEARNALEGLGTSEREIREEQQEEAVNDARNALEGIGTSSQELAESRQEDAAGRARNALEGIGTSEREIIESQVRAQLESQGRNPDRFDVSVDRQDDGSFDVSAERQEFTDIDFSFGFGDPNVDEVEQAAEDFGTAFEEFTSPATSRDSAISTVQDTRGLQAGIASTVGGLPKDTLEFTENALFVLENKRNPGIDSAATSRQKTQNLLDAQENVVDIGTTSVEFYKENPDKLDELAGSVLGGFAIGTGGSAALRRINLPDSTGRSFRSDTRGQVDFGSKTKTKELVIDESTTIDDIDMSQLSKSSQVDVLRELNKRETKTPRQRAQERLPDVEEFDSVEEYQRELSRATARERLPDVEEFGSREEYQRELDRLSERLRDEIEVDEIELRDQDTAQATSEVAAIDGLERTTSAGGIGGGIIGGIEAVSDVERGDSQKTAEAGAVAGADVQLEDSLFDDSAQSTSISTTGVQDDVTAVDVTADGVTTMGTTPTTTTTTTPTTTTITTTDLPATDEPITDFPELSSRRLPELDLDMPKGKKKRRRAFDVGLFEREFESPIATPEEIISGDIEDQLNLDDI